MIFQEKIEVVFRILDWKVNWWLRVIEPSEHDGATFRTLGTTQFDCVGVNEVVQKKPTLLGRITERPVWYGPYQLIS